MATSAAPTQKIQRQDAYCASRPPPAKPATVPSPEAPADSATAVAALPSGSSRRARASVSG